VNFFLDPSQLANVPMSDSSTFFKPSTSNMNNYTIEFMCLEEDVGEDKMSEGLTHRNRKVRLYDNSKNYLNDELISVTNLIITIIMCLFTPS
ncbi:hypothetical protein THOM_0947, partial [Trachipleistophora hominis]